MRAQWPRRRSKPTTRRQLRDQKTAPKQVSAAPPRLQKVNVHTASGDQLARQALEQASGSEIYGGVRLPDVHPSSRFRTMSWHESITAFALRFGADDRASMSGTAGPSVLV